MILGGTTLHSGLDFNFGNNFLALNDKKLDQFRLNLRNLEVVVVDEMSMVSSDMLYKINQRLLEILLNEDHFGGLAFVLVGDILQLQPVQGAYVFQDPKSQKYKPMHSVEPLWSVFDVVILSTNHRQGEGTLWANMLNRFRIGIVLEEDEKIMETRRVKNFSKERIFDACHVFYTNKEVEDHNLKKLNSLTTALHEMKASCIFPKGYSPPISSHGTIGKTQFKKLLQLKIGARVMMIFNVNISDCLINGSLGTIIDFYIENKSIEAVIVKFDNPEAGKVHRLNNSILSSKYEAENGTPVFRTSFEYNIPGKSGRSHSCKGKIVQIPLKLAWASTCHKLQGGTIKKGSDLVAHGHKRLPKCMGYVMLGRCECLYNVFIDDAFDMAKIKCDEAALKENEELNKRDCVPDYLEQRWDLFYVNIRSLPKHFKDIQCDLQAQRSEIICLAETWLNYGEEEGFDLEDKICTFATEGRGKGCAVYHPIHLEKPLAFIGNSFQMVSWVTKNDFQIFFLYVSQGAPYLDIVQEIKKRKLPGYQPFILGDFNFQSNSKNDLTSFFKELSLINLIEGPTHKEGGSIDHVYVPLALKDSILTDTSFKYYTDHAAIFVKFLD